MELHRIKLSFYEKKLRKINLKNRILSFET